MNKNMVLLPNKEGDTVLGVLTPFGVVTISTFSYDELRRFAMGILGYVEHFHPEVPEVYIRAFKEDKDAH